MGSVKQSGIQYWQLKITCPKSGDVLKIANFKSLHLAQNELADLQNRYIMWQPWRIEIIPVLLQPSRDSDIYYTSEGLLTKRLRELCAAARISRRIH